MAVGVNDCLRAADIARMEQQIESLHDYQVKQNGSLDRMDNSIRLIAASADNRFGSIFKWLLGLQTSIIIVLLGQILILVRGTP